ncbi:MAG: TRM11 family methyltransferase [Steroidobacteraceae bacterium]
MSAREFVSGFSEDSLASLVEAARDAEPVSGFTHNFYRYPARFSPKFVRAAISALSEPGDLILDPFMGGGTTLVEALALGRQAIGADISSLAAFLSQVKTTLYSEDDLVALERWAARAPSQIHMHKEGSTDKKYAEDGYYRHMDSRSTWRLRKAIEQSLKSAKRLDSPKLERFARCAILRTGQWALDGRKRLPSVSGFRKTLEENALDMIEGARELRNAATAVRAGKNPFVHCLNRSTIGLEQEPLLTKLQKPRLVVTSPPYPGTRRCRSPPAPRI